MRYNSSPNAERTSKAEVEKLELERARSGGRVNLGVLKSPLWGSLKLGRCWVGLFVGEHSVYRSGPELGDMEAKGSPQNPLTSLLIWGPLII